MYYVLVGLLNPYINQSVRYIDDKNVLTCYALDRSNICRAIDPVLSLQFDTSHLVGLLQTYDFEMCNNTYNPANSCGIQSFIHFFEHL